MRLGCEVLAVDRYPGAPAMQVAQRHAVIDMTDPGGAARRARRPSARARARSCSSFPSSRRSRRRCCSSSRHEGLHVVPTARAARLTMDREGIRRLVAEELGLQTCDYRFCDTEEEVRARGRGARHAVRHQAGDVVVGQGPVGDPQRRRRRRRVGVRPAGGPHRRRPRDRRGVRGLRLRDHAADDPPRRRHVVLRADRPPPGGRRLPRELAAARDVRRRRSTAPATLARQVTDALGGTGIFGVELFVCGDEVIFSEVSPRPHDTGMTTMATQALSEFALHVRAILGLPRARRRGAAAVAGRLGGVPGDGARRRAGRSPAWPRRWRSIPASTCACSPSPTRGPTAAWPSRSPAARTRPPRARPRAPRPPACASTDARPARRTPSRSARR